MGRARPAPERFWEKVDKRGPNGCWTWQGFKNNWGYGQFWHEQRMAKAHRYSFELANGPLPKEVLVLHRCDNPPCVNPAHLFAGDNFINRQDSLNKDRLGSNAKVKVEQVKQIKMRLSQALTNIAKEFGVSTSIVSNIGRGKTWRTVGDWKVLQQECRAKESGK
jgi:hypothetical protein